MLLLSTSPKLPRRQLLILPPLVLLAIIYFYLNTRQSWRYSTDLGNGSLASPRHPSKLWRSFAPILEVTAPKCSPPIAFQNGKAFSAHPSESREDFNMSKAEIACLHRSHTLFVDLVNFGAPRLDFKKGTKGLATLAAKSGFPVLLTNIFMLRRTGSALLLEVFLETEDDYEPNMCEVVLPRWNATCIVLSSLIGASSQSFKLAGADLWPFALLFSSFESVLFLGAGTFLVRSPDALFDSDPFMRTGLVTWPSMKYASFPGQSFELFGLDSDISSHLRANDNRQILLSKKQHAVTLFMATYHSIYHAYYGPLINELDFVSSAAAIMKIPFYQVDHHPRQLGNSSATSATLQFDASPDFNCTESCKPAVMFVHTNWLSPESGLSTTMEVFERLWGSEEECRDLYWQDIEGSAWASVTSAFCNRETVCYDYNVCFQAIARLSTVFGSSNMKDFGSKEISS